MDGKLITSPVPFALDANPSYRVHFFSDHNPESPDSEYWHSEYWHSEYWQLTAPGDVREALARAEDHRESRGYTLYAEWEDLEGCLLFSRLAGDGEPDRERDGGDAEPPH